MDRFQYRDGRLFCEDVDAESIADAAGTPTYVYSLRTLLDHHARFAEAFAPLKPLVCFAIKSNSNLSVLRALVERGAGMDLVSGGELHRALEAGADPARCVFAGVGKTDEEIRAAIAAGLGWFNVESEAEFENLDRLASEAGRPARAALRVNPDVDPRTHRYTATGKRESKFGVDIDRAREFFRRNAGREFGLLRGIHLHIGSPVNDVEPFVRAIEKTLDLIDGLSGDGIEIEMLDLGGGFGADYETNQSPLAREYASAIVPLLEERARAGLQIVLEPGRSLAANAGILLARVQYVKRSSTKTFVITDAGMHTLLRPSHYGSFHFIWPTAPRREHVPATRAKEPDLPGLETVDVVGPICESGDFLAQDRRLPPVKRGDVIAVFAAGAYGMTMASRYNSMPLPAEVLVDGGEVRVVRERETYEDLVRHERRPRVLQIEPAPAAS